MVSKRKLFSVSAGVLISVFLVGSAVFASDANFSQTINPGTLVAGILDNQREAVTDPSVTMTAQNFSFDCQYGDDASTGLLGSDSERIYVSNPSAATDGWTLSLAATDGSSAVWENGDSSATISFNDPAGEPAGCDTGQMTVDPSDGILESDCTTCSNANISKGSGAAFNQGVVDSVTLLNAASNSDDVWRGYLTDVEISQTIPAETPADTFTIDLTLTATAQ